MAIESEATREKVLKAAERLFSKNGFSGASLRQITEEAGANLAAVNYHFGSKEDLYKEVLLRRVRPMNEERLTLLAQAEQLAGEQPLPLRAILDAFIRPLLSRATDRAPGGLSFLRLISRELADPQPFLFDEMAREFDPLVKRYTHAFAQTLPGLPPVDLFWRMQFTTGTLLYAAARQHDFERISSGLWKADDVEGCMRRLVDYCTAGLGAPRSAA
ncbi:MAG: TetR family transcriptional regulator [Opitutaceae bacterium]|nr:TetR family transcriptional regulator [Opitutaceae bacterium]